MTSQATLIKDTDYETRFRCAGGVGILREEVWRDVEGNIVRYNLAFLLPHQFHRDHGRVLGYDNAHGVHERHFQGNVTLCSFESYPATSAHFFREVQLLRRTYEDPDLR